MTIDLLEQPTPPTNERPSTSGPYVVHNKIQLYDYYDYSVLAKTNEAQLLRLNDRHTPTYTAATCSYKLSPYV